MSRPPTPARRGLRRGLRRASPVHPWGPGTRFQAGWGSAPLLPHLPLSPRSFASDFFRGSFSRPRRREKVFLSSGSAMLGVLRSRGGTAPEGAHHSGYHCPEGSITGGVNHWKGASLRGHSCGGPHPSEGNQRSEGTAPGAGHRLQDASPGGTRRSGGAALGTHRPGERIAPGSPP